MSYIRRSALCLFITASFAFPCSAQSAIQFSREVSYFGGMSKIYPWPNHALFGDTINNRILNMAISGVTQADLEKTGIVDAASRLDSLVKGQCLRIEGKTYRMAFPVITGEAREEIRNIVDTAAGSAAPVVSEMITRLERAVPARREVLFHLLWSQAMDSFWWPAWSILHGRARKQADGLPSVAWVLSPDHSREVGTNYNDLPGGGNIAITWSPNAKGHILPINELRSELERIVWGMTPSAPGKLDLLRAAGCVDRAGLVQAFVFRSGDALDKLLEKTSKEYAAIVAKLYDYEALASRFGTAPGQLFVILQHETAYAIYDMLIKQGKLTFPAALDGEGNPEACAQLVSLRLKKRPKP